MAKELPEAVRRELVPLLEGAERERVHEIFRMAKMQAREVPITKLTNGAERDEFLESLAGESEGRL